MRSGQRVSRPSSSGPRAMVHGTGLGPSDRALHKLMDVLPHERWRRIVNIVNHEKLAQAGLETRFGAGWPGLRCGARTRSGGACQNPAIKGRSRCKLHGGRSTGPRTPEGKARFTAAPAARTMDLSIPCSHPWSRHRRTTLGCHTCVDKWVRSPRPSPT
ncbi:MAG: HGGxSTG domain-containing protein [Alphaproteobacteria bacterium]